MNLLGVVEVDREVYDYIVVGGGSAGAIVAARLSQATARVLLLEAGTTDRRLGVRIPAAIQKIYKDANWRYVAEPDPTRGDLKEARSAGKILGGGGSVNSCVFVRGHRADFDGWAKLGATGWDYESALPAFRRLESWERGADGYRGGDGPISVVVQTIRGEANTGFLDAARQAGYSRNPDYNASELDGCSFTQVNQRRGFRSQSSHEYLRRVASGQHLTLRTSAFAYRVLTEDGRAAGVEYRLDGQTRRAYAREEVLLGAGPYGTAKLLLLSGIGPRDVLSDVGVDLVCHSPGVGGNLQDHVYVIQPYRARIHTLNKRRPSDIAKGLTDFVLHGSGILTASVVQAIAMHRTDSGLEAPDTQIGFTPFAITREITPEGVKVGPAKDEGFNAASMWLTPRTRGRVRLRSANAADGPLIEHNLLADPDDLRDVLRAMQEVRRIMEQPAMKELTDGPFPGPAECRTDADWEAYARANAVAPSHPVGTCKMGSDDDAVVDPQLRVRGVAGLRVVDSSVMPTVTRGNTNAPAMMIAERAADFILGR
jgi:choline dehydrogenase